MDDYDIIQQYEFGITCELSYCSDYATNIAQLTCCKRSFFLCDFCWANLMDYITIIAFNKKRMMCQVCEVVHDVPHASFELQRL